MRRRLRYVFLHLEDSWPRRQKQVHLAGRQTADCDQTVQQDTGMTIFDGLRATRRCAPTFCMQCREILSLMSAEMFLFFLFSIFICFLLALQLHLAIASHDIDMLK